MSRSQSYRDQVVGRLKDLIDSRGLSVAALEKELGRGRGYVGDAFRGDKRLSLEMILEVLEILGVEPDSLFGGVSRRSAWVSSGRPSTSSEIAEGGRRPAPAPGRHGQIEDSSLVIQALVLLLERKGFLSTAELLSACRELQSR